MSIVKINPSTLTVTHICDGEEVVTGGEDGQVWVATFADRSLAAYFVAMAKENLFHLKGERRTEGKSASDATKEVIRG